MPCATSGLSRIRTWRSNIAGERAKRSIAGPGGRPGSAQVAVIALGARLGAGGEGRDRHDPDRLSDGRGPGRVGLVASLNRPGGNITGVSNSNAEFGPKRLELLHELMPAATLIAPDQPDQPNAEGLTRDLRAAARTLGLQLHVLHASLEPDSTRRSQRRVK